MCGIAGIVHLNGQSVNQEALDTLTDALAHRGPDARGTCLRENVGLGHRRLAIVDLSPLGVQPMTYKEEKLVITFNGEVYNYQEERKLLEAKGYRFRSQSDTEVLLALYQEYGDKCVERLRGQFAFAILDTEKQRVFLARDRVGKKPIKYFQAGDTLVFASELKALRTHPLCPKEVDAEAVHHFLTMMYVPAPSTGIRGIHKLPAGHTMTVDLQTKDVRIERYWSLRYDAAPARSPEEWSETFWNTFQESTRLRMIADVPVGAFLSGGIDSAAVVCAMAAQSAVPVKTFSIGSDDERYNELPLAAQTAKMFRTEHREIPLQADIVRLLPEIVRTYEEPYGDPSAIPTYLVAQATREHVTVALNGDGGDENFAGYVRYPILQFSELWRKLPVHFLMKPLMRAHHALRQNTFSYRAQRFEDSIHLPWPKRYLQYLSFFTEEEKRALYAPGVGTDWPRTDDMYAARTEAARERAHSLVHKAMSMDMDTYLADDLMPKVDLGAMAHGLEARSPFLDHVLLEQMASMPDAFKLHGRTRKWLLKKLLRGKIPDAILDAPKRGFRIPFDTWFRTSLRSYVTERILCAPPSYWELFEKSAVETFLHDYFANNVDYSDHVWALLWLSEWMRQYTAEV